MFISSQENLLRNVLGLPVIACQAGGGRKNHILISTHEGRELDFAAGLRGSRLHCSVVFYAHNTAGGKKLQPAQFGQSERASEAR
jgi:hypothetical protein